MSVIFLPHPLHDFRKGGVFHAGIANGSDPVLLRFVLPFPDRENILAQIAMKSKQKFKARVMKK
jgi:hypothetical protein